MELLLDVSFVDKVFENYFQKSTLSNNYMLKDEYLTHIENERIYFDIDDINVFFYLKKNGFFRLYYFINTPEKSYPFENELPLVLEILYRGEKNFPIAHQYYWLRSGFSSHLSRDCYFLKNKNLERYPSDGTIKIGKAESPSDFTYAKKLIDLNLDLYTGDNLGEAEIAHFADQGLIFLSTLDGQPCGMLQAENKNNIFWLGHLVVDENYRGKGIAKALVEAYISEGIQAACNQLQLWVIQDNSAAVHLYKKYGFVYLNKSTYSMLKK